MVHRVVFRVGSEEALDFWAERTRRHARARRRAASHDPEGLALELVVDDSGDEPLVAKHPEIPEELALRGFAGVRAYASSPSGARRCSRALGFDARAGRRAASGAARFYVYDDRRRSAGCGRGTVHHVAWASPTEEHEAWRERVARGRRRSRRR